VCEPPDGQRPRVLSLTRALNSASNRAVRRILLSRSWPSSDALNLSLRRVLASGVIPIEGGGGARAGGGDLDAKSESAGGETSGGGRRGRSDGEWVEDQMAVFRDSYEVLPGYEYADAYLECILSLATTGVESPRVAEVVSGAVYDDSYRRVISVLKSVGTVFEEVPTTTTTTTTIEVEPTDEVDATTTKPGLQIAQKLLDQDICWSMLDKISIRNAPVTPPVTVVMEEEEKEEVTGVEANGVSPLVEEEMEVEEEVEVEPPNEIEVVNIVEEPPAAAVEEKDTFNGGMMKILSWLKGKKTDLLDNEKNPINAAANTEPTLETVQDEEEEEEDEEVEMEQEVIEEPEPEPVGVLLSDDEPTVTRQLNVLANIVKRALLFGGDQELLVLSETLEADKLPFIRRWYPDTDGPVDDDVTKETRPGVQYFNCLVLLLKNCYEYGVVSEINPPLPLMSSYANSYERLTALLVELGSGYIKPINDKSTSLSGTPVPKTPTEEFVRFAQLEFAIRKKISPDVTNYPDELIGTWQVKDEIEGKIIGTSTVVFNPEGEVYVEPPLRGLRWRLDPGPTHLDTCTFQVLSEDGAILQYRGFMDRGARIESRFSKRAVKIRGAVTFQMRDGGEVAKNVRVDAGVGVAGVGGGGGVDILPVTTQTGTTRFVMSKVFDLDDKIWSRGV